ncbi:MAG: CaiB/BaiF CoA transferase family protein [Betaproteobacteria bacterium]
MTNSNLPLSGVRILTIEQYGAGPYATMHMADLGAEVIKLESPPREGFPPGDMSRQSGPYFLGEHDSQFFQSFNRNKRSVSIEIRNPHGRELFLKLVKTADAVVNNLRGDQPGRLAVTYDDLKSVNPRIVCGHLSGYGRTGSRANWPAYDYLAPAEAGYLDITGEPGTPPARMGLSMIDYMGGVTAAFAVTSALYGALRSGKGCDVDVSLYDVAMHQLTYPAIWYLNEGHITDRRPRSGHPSTVPCELMPTADGWIFIMCITPRFWTLLCEKVGAPALVSDPRFVGYAERRANRQALVDILDPIFKTRTTAKWMEIFASTVPAAPVLTLPQALDNPYFAETEGIVTVAHPDKPGGLRMIARPVRVNGHRPGAVAAPKIGADTQTILGELGITASELAALRQAGAI